MHHVLFDDGEEGLVNLSEASYQFLTPPLAPAAAAATPAGQGQEPEQAAAGEAAGSVAATDVGERLHVWWPEDKGGGGWYSATVTHVLRNG